MLWKFKHGNHSSVKWDREVPERRPSQELKVVSKSDTVDAFLNGKHVPTHQLAEPVSGKFGVWSKADSHEFIDDDRVIGSSPPP